MMILSLWLYSLCRVVMLLMIVIKPCDTSMPKVTLVCVDMMVGLGVSHGSMYIMNPFCRYETFLRHTTLVQYFFVEMANSNKSLIIISHMLFFSAGPSTAT